MPSGKIGAAADHLARIVGTKPVSGLAELVWNALDANATTVEIRVVASEMGGVDHVVVKDNGHGFAVGEIDDVFGHVGGSWKHYAAGRKTRGGDRVLHGDKGEGRWKAFSIGQRVSWESVTEGPEGEPNQRVRLVISDQRLDEFEWSGPFATDDPPGTTVEVIAGQREPKTLQTEAGRRDLLGALALYLTKYPTVTVTYDTEALVVSDLIARTDELTVEFDNPHGPVEVTVIEWATAMDRALYLCDEHGSTLHETHPNIHARGFVFTAYIRWAGFRIYESLLPLADMDNDQVGPAVNAAREALRQHFRARRVDTTRSVVQEWRDEDVYPYPADPGDAVEQTEQALFNYVAVTASDAVNRIDDHQAKRLSLSAIRVAVEQDPGSLEMIFREVLNLPEEKIEEFRQLLERTSLTALMDAMRLVTGRLEFITGLELLLFDPVHAPQVLERAHLHKMIESEPWLFGEEFATHVSDKGLGALLEAHLQILGRDALLSEPVTDEDGKARRVDFLFGRALELNRDRREHLVVEIKRPTITVGRAEMDQIEDYARAVVSDSRFDLGAVDWDFVLVANDLDSLATSRANQPNRPRGLLFEDEAGVRIWVRLWSEIIQGCKHRLRFIRDQLEYDPDADQAVSYLRETYPDYVPEHLAQHAPGDETGQTGATA